MNFAKKWIFKIVLEAELNYLVQYAEKFITEAKSGDKKKEYVINIITEFCKYNGWEKYLDLEKLSKFIEEKVLELINKA